MRSVVSTTFVLALTLALGCATYNTPGGRADFRAIGLVDDPAATAGTGQPTDAVIASGFAKRPAARFPASVAVVRVQATGYRSPTAQTYGQGTFCVVTGRDVEPEGAIEGLASLPMLRGIGPLNRLLLPSTLQNEYDLRKAAAELHADMLLIYTFDTSFNREDDSTPLNVVTLGITPTQQTRIGSVASAILMDTRTGFIYGLADGQASFHARQNAWVTPAAIDNDRRKVEAEAFEKMVKNMTTTWHNVVREHATPRDASTDVRG